MLYTYCTLCSCDRIFQFIEKWLEPNDFALQLQLYPEWFVVLFAISGLQRTALESALSADLHPSAVCWSSLLPWNSWKGLLMRKFYQEDSLPTLFVHSMLLTNSWVVSASLLLLLVCRHSLNLGVAVVYLVLPLFSCCYRSPCQMHCHNFPCQSQFCLSVMFQQEERSIRIVICGVWFKSKRFYFWFHHCPSACLIFFWLVNL